MVIAGHFHSDYRWGRNSRITKKMRDFRHFGWQESVSRVAFEVLLFWQHFRRYDYR
jgi:hypothetical protein